MNPLFTTAFAEETTELSQALEGATKEEALAAGTIMGVSLGIIVTLAIVYYILRVIADWKIFTKAGRAGWKSLIPILCNYEEYGICWESSIGLIYGIGTLAIQIINYCIKAPAMWLNYVMLFIGIVCLVLNFKQSMKLSRSFGKGTGFGWGLFLLGPIFRLVLGFGSAQSAGHPDR